MDGQNYRVTDGDRLDLVVLKHYGNHDMLNKVIEANSWLCSEPLVLESGKTIFLPMKTEVTKQIEETHKILEEKALW